MMAWTIFPEGAAELVADTREQARDLILAQEAKGLRILFIRCANGATVDRSYFFDPPLEKPE